MASITRKKKRRRNEPVKDISTEEVLSAVRSGDSDSHPYLAILGLRARETADIVEWINAGLPFGAWERFTHLTGLSNELVARIVQVPLRTLSRRREEGRLQPDESDRLVRIARIFFLALGLVNGIEPARRWLTAPQAALGGALPLEYAATEVGARAVEMLIGRLEHGIPS